MPPNNFLPLNFEFSLLDFSVKMEMDPLNIFFSLNRWALNLERHRSRKRDVCFLAPVCLVSRILQHAELQHQLSAALLAPRVPVLQDMVNSSTQQPTAPHCTSLRQFCSRVPWWSTSCEQLSPSKLQGGLLASSPLGYYWDFSAAQ